MLPPDTGTSDVVFDDATFWGAGLFFFVLVAEHLLVRA
jgi:hypothetical protein